tara:strand:- start:215 stop:1069 length:855 start_codon:yes stop_codon:yes gene_type:complete
LIKKYRDEINFIWELTKIFMQFSAVAGILVTLIYCGTIGYFPTGLTLGDALFFVAASLSFVLMYSLISAAMLYAGISSSVFLRWLQPLIFFVINKARRLARKPPLLIRVSFPILTFDYLMPALVGILVFLLNAIAYYRDIFKAASLTGAILLLGFFWGLFNTKPRRKEYNFVKERRLKIGLAVFMYCIPLLVIESKGSFLNLSMAMIGVRVESTSVQMDKKYTEFLKANKIFPSQTNPLGEGIYEDVTVLFRGVGSELSVKVDGFSLAIPSDEIIVGIPPTKIK